MTKAFISFSHADDALRAEFEKHLSLLRRQGLLDIWTDRRIHAGSDIHTQIEHQLENADIVLLLVSSDFLASDYCFGIEMKRALERHHEGSALVVPLILRPSDWHAAPFGALKAVPMDGKPVVKWPSVDEGFLDAVQTIRKLLQNLALNKPITGSASAKTTESSLNELTRIKSKPDSENLSPAASSASQATKGGKSPVQKGGYLIPWITDPSVILSDSDKSGDRLRRLVLIRSVESSDFEALGSQFVSGDRGTGKSSILLKRAATLLSEKDAKRYRTLRAHAPFVNELTQNSILIPSNQGFRLASPLLWGLYWRLTLVVHFACLALRYRNVTEVRDIDRIIENHFRVLKSSERTTNPTAFEFFRSVWLGSNGSLESLAPAMCMLTPGGVPESLVREWIAIAENVLFASLSAINQEIQLTIFVDGLDEALADSTGGPLVRNAFNADIKHTDGAMGSHSTALTLEQSVEVWQSAQVGFMLAAEYLWDQSAQTLRTYGTLRSEVLSWYAESTATSKSRQKMFGGRTTVLTYTRQHLAEVLALNVRYTEDKDLFAPLGDLPAEAAPHCLFGFDWISSSLTNRNSEELLSYMIRHTFGAPRHVVGLARRALRALPDPGTRATAAGEILNAITAEAQVIFRDFIADVTPPWTRELHQLSLNLRSDVISIEAMTLFERDHACPGFFDSLYSRGVLGCPRKTAHGFMQVFRRPDGTHESTNEIPYAVLHPAFASFIFGNSPPVIQDDFYVADFVIGSDLPCPGKWEPPRLLVSYNEQSGRFKFVLDMTPVSCSVFDNEFPLEELVVAMIAYAVARPRKRFADAEDLRSQASEFQAHGIYRDELRGRPLVDLAREICLARDTVSQPRLVRRTREWLRNCGLSLTTRSSKVDGSSMYSIEAPNTPVFRVSAKPIGRASGTSTFAASLRVSQFKSVGEK